MGTIQWGAEDRHDLRQVAAEVIRWRDYVPDSPLYRLFADRISGDPELLGIVAAIDNTPPLNLLFGAVKLGLDADDQLAAWYPHLAGRQVAEPSDAAYAAFRHHVLANRDALLPTASARRTQTNEVGRAAVLLPWIPTDEPVHAIDIGASAGLNLCLDHFSYRYSGDVDVALGTHSPRIDCEVRGPLAGPRRLPAFASRTGIDLAPVDATDPAQAAWLEALVWPEHVDRLERLRAAIGVRRECDVRMLTADAASVLTDVIAALPPGPVVVWHTIALYQADAEARAYIDAAVEAAAGQRAVTRIGFEPVAGVDSPVVRVGPSFDHGRTVATAHPHGRWLQPVA
ncbi:DUF2332 domain-containing protein [uncultured Demequina sp.]|uniref:DUF2332 domain-containing protein n=1 Tax=uncultured Demequina sp. TaxID=693499 RepID=UPI0025D161C8|nr:DUF2332 domain-containing protein [uncultured Demequina sp.]